MSNWDIGVVTDVGRAALAKVEAGTATAEFVSMAIGNGAYSTAEIATLVRATALKSQKLSSGFSARRFSAADTLALKASFSNATVDTDFYITECGIFMDVTEGGTTTTILFAISFTETPDVMSAYNGSYPQIVTNEYYLPISSESTITVEMSSVAYALAEDLNMHEAVHGNANSFGHVKVDSAFSSTSENAIQNKEVTNGKADRSNIAPVEVSTTPATQDYAIGAQFYLDNVLYKAKTAITADTAWSNLVLGTNYEVADDVSSQIQALTNNKADVSTLAGEFTTDGVKTYKQLLTELSTAIDLTKIRFTSVLTYSWDNGDSFLIYHITRKTNNAIGFTCVSQVIDQLVTNNIGLNRAGYSSFYTYSTDSSGTTTVTNSGDTVPEAGLKYSIYY